MLVMPLSGYLASNFSKHGVRFFGMTWAPWGPDMPAVYALFNGVHVATAWLFTALIAGHVLAAAKDGLLDRDGIAARMWAGGAPTRPVARTPPFAGQGAGNAALHASTGLRAPSPMPPAAT